MPCVMLEFRSITWQESFVVSKPHDFLTVQVSEPGHLEEN